ncbi:hypothetical protein AB7M49_004158 [Bradyrhizobium elkanii]
MHVLRSRLGRIIRDIRRKMVGQPALEEAFALLLSRATQIRSQQQRQRGWKLYSFHVPEVECISKSKGKASPPYELGLRASIVTNNRRAPGGLFVLHARAMPDNPYDGHMGGGDQGENSPTIRVRLRRWAGPKGGRSPTEDRPHRRRAFGPVWRPGATGASC